MTTEIIRDYSAFLILKLESKKGFAGDMPGLANPNAF